MRTRPATPSPQDHTQTTATFCRERSAHLTRIRLSTESPRSHRGSTVRSARMLSGDELGHDATAEVPGDGGDEKEQSLAAAPGGRTPCLRGHPDGVRDAYHDGREGADEDGAHGLLACLAAEERSDHGADQGREREG